MPPRSTLALLLLTLSANAAVAAAPGTNYTGLWLTPGESGWGLNLIQQGETMFGTLYVYGPDNSARWYSASNLACDGGNPNRCVGALAESSGSPFSAPFDASTVSRREVGEMSIEFGETSAALSYAVDATRVTKTVAPFAWKANDLSGKYFGVQYTPPNGGTPEAGDLVDITIRHDTAAGTFRIDSSLARTSVACTHTGTAIPRNMSIHLAGTYTCSDGRSGPVAMDVDPAADGFATAGFTGSGAGATRVAAARTGYQSFNDSGWMNDLWLTDGESGWGLNILGQGDTLFATLFAYDAGRRPKWYSASALRFVGGIQNDELDSGDRGRYEGELVESTGPWFGVASFNPGAVSRRVVGTMKLRFVSGRAATLDYTIDGVTVSKLIKPYAFRRNVLSGSYFALTSRFGREETGSVFTLAVEDSGVSGTRLLRGDCIYDGSRQQDGQRVVVNGSWACGPNGSTSGTFGLNDVEVSRDGFSGRMRIGGGGTSHIAAVRAGS